MTTEFAQYDDFYYRSKYKISDLFYIQITTSGEPISKLDAKSSKQPYELIFFASTETCKKKWETILGNSAEQRVIVSVPSGIHSHKPPLHQIFTELKVIQEDSHCLEIFGRYLIPNWTTFGNQSLKLQNIKYFYKTSLIE